MEISPTATCPSCKLPVLAEFYFCPNCGRQLRSKAISVSVAKQIGIYIFSFLLPPLGFYPAIKYIRQPNPRTKLIGWIAVAITIISITLTLILVAQAMNQYAQLLDKLSSPLSY